MGKKIYILLFVFLIISFSVRSQENKKVNDSLMFQGQLSLYVHYNPTNVLPVAVGGRYLPELNYQLKFPKHRLIDFEVSANIYGNSGFDFQDSSHFDGKIKPYRLWARYTTKQFEFRLGLQKINFGSASMLRPLMWFEQVDPRDPLRFTDGVWAALGRYYFLNNANIWVWALYGNENTKGWESIKTNIKYPEIGGRIQAPLKKGELAFSYNYRIADSRELTIIPMQMDIIPEHKFGFDIKMDFVVGCWMEASWVNKQKNLGMLTNQEILNLGVDYTFGIGNGLSVVYEHLMVGTDQNAFEFQQGTMFSMANLSYPITMFDNLSSIFYYDWTNNSTYSFVNWSHQFNKFTLFLMAYSNPKKYLIPAQGAADNLYAGNGLQIMFVYNH